jgi:hypothetical protein
MNLGRAACIALLLLCSLPGTVVAQAGQLIVQLRTGGDDLRGGNDNVNVVMLRRSGGPLRFANVNRRQRWAENSTHTVNLPLPAGLRFEDILGVRLETSVSGGAGGDNWNLDRLIVKARIGGAERTLFEQAGGPLVRFTGERRMQEFLFVAGPLPPSPPVRTAFQPAQHGWKFVNSFKNLIGVFDITTGGLCGGMVYSALDYFYARAPIPRQTFMPAEGTPLQSYIYGRQVNSLERNLDRWAELGFNPGGARNREFFTWGLQVGSGRLGQLMERIDRGDPVPLGLWECGGDCRCTRAGKTANCPGYHQILAIGYELGRYRGDVGQHIEDLSIFVYDPNYPGATLSLKPHVAGAYYYYRERPNNWDHRWRAYFADVKYSRAAPLAVSASPRFLVAEFHTGGDDLRGGNDNVHVVLNLRGRAPLRFDNVNGGKRWINESKQTVSRPLPAGVGFDDIVGARLETTFRGGMGGDNWNLDYVKVLAQIDGRECTLLVRGRPLKGVGTPLIRFTGDRRNLDLPFNRAERRCP